MSFVLPWMLGAGLLAALGVVALHLLSTQRPPLRPLPTARFVPESDLRAVSRSARPTDLLLLALRVLAVLLIAAAFAQPVPNAPGPSLRRVVLLEWTSGLADPAAARRAAQAALGDGDALIVFDTAARIVAGDGAAARAALDTLAPATVRRAALSPALAAVGDAAAAIARGADSLEVVVLSAFSADSWDAATAAWRSAWPGRITATPLAGVRDTLSAPRADLRDAGADHPLTAAFERLPAARGAHPLRLRRSALRAEDSLWLQETADAVLLHWPDAADSLRPDGVLASAGSAAVLVAPLARRPVAEGQVIAWWRDGSPAATERAVGRGCLRDVGIGIPLAGDLTLRAPFGQLLGLLAAPCGGARAAPADSATLAALVGAGPLASAASLAEQRETSALTPWLLAAALALLLIEQWLRGRARLEAA